MVDKTVESPPVDSQESATRQRFWLVAILLFSVMVAYFDRVNVSVLVANDAFLVDMGIKGKPVQIGMLMTFFLVAYGFGNLVLSSLGDAIGPRKTMAIAILVWGAAMLMGGLAQSFAVILASRLLLGLGEGMHFPMQSTYVKKWFPRQERARANAVWFIGTSLAPALAMPVFAWLIASYGWRESFYACVLVGFLPLYFIWFHTTDTPRTHPRVNAGELRHIESGLEPDAPAGKKADRAVIRENLLLLARNHRFWLLVVYYAVHNFVYWGLLTWLPTYLKNSRGFSWSQMGMLSSLPFILSIVCKLLGGWASDWVGRRAPFCVLATLGAAASLFLTARVTDNLAAAGLICLGMGVLTLGAPLAFTMLQEMVPGRAISQGVGIMNGLSFFFASLGPVFIGFFIGLPDGFTWSLYFLAFLAFVGTLATSVLALQKY